MKHFSFLRIISLLVFGLLFSADSTAQCTAQMEREHANYFARDVGYQGYGMLPMLGVQSFANMMTNDLRYYYEKEIPTCSYCLKSSVLASWGNDLAICNAANYYHNLYMADHNRSIQMMDLEIQRLRNSSH